MIIDPEPVEDERGSFARTFCAEEFAARGLETRFVQQSVSHNRRRGTLRGMHYQAAPHSETKLIRCTAGAVYDVLVDLRGESPTFKRWIAVELTARSRRALYVPPGLAHGFLTLEDETEIHYQITPAYRPEASRGVRWDDPSFGIDWPLEPTVISAKDHAYPDYVPERA